MTRLRVSTGEGVLWAETRFEEDDASSISPPTQMAQARLPLGNQRS